ncbi:MAG: ABC transporter permease [Streptosporangiales bacterium]|nr:ABC transporter permease [Streptosporangiales bacterium]
MTALRHTRLIFVRSIRPTLRSPSTLLFGVAQPVLYLALFGPLLADVGGPGGATSWQWFVPGLLVQLVLFTTAYAGFSLIPDQRSGAQERLRATPVSRLALLLGRVLSNVVMLVAQAVLLVLPALAFGFRVPLAAALLGLLLLAALGVAIGAASYALATHLRNEYEFAPALGSTVVPLMLLSGILLPMDAGPRWLYVVSRFNPLSHVVDAERALTLGRYGAGAVMVGALVTAGLVVVCTAWGVRAFRRSPA